MAWMYILLCADGSYYTGLTRGEDPDQRVSEHQMFRQVRTRYRGFRFGWFTRNTSA
ncbi:GIY-YIG nuclease family protein [Nordella sp. HKS 07]|uniref:GIY-YIG nuclease family protein n=1 Tax=Nordella sp. HKS 07 TaxID=2712222 RepID=UPI00352F9881